jgi:type II restriction enzyme
MDLSFDTKIADGYSSKSQRIRVLTESWVDNSIFCPNCGHSDINKYPNNRPVADFYCSNCKEEYELKSKQGSVGAKMVDGAYHTMIERLGSSNNPNFFILNYSLHSLEVLNFFVVPKYFFVPEIIEKRKPLLSTARRAGWVGCNILLDYIPQAGKIFIVREGAVEPKDKVLLNWKKTLFLREEMENNTKGWLLDIMLCIEKLGCREFSLAEIYAFEEILGKKYPNNHHIKDKMRQQLQILRDRGYLEFTNRGNYRLI